ncbi:MAG: hypothetical protein ACRESZ_08245, partial [Methylococcales bacterium]
GVGSARKVLLCRFFMRPIGRRKNANFAEMRRVAFFCLSHHAGSSALVISIGRDHEPFKRDEKLQGPLGAPSEQLFI